MFDDEVVSGNPSSIAGQTSNHEKLCNLFYD
jgi:hypothetical protein